MVDVAATLVLCALVGLSIGTVSFLIGREEGERDTIDYVFDELGGGTYRLGKETPDEKLETALTELMVAMNKCHCNNYDSRYCDNECPAKAGADECVWCKCYELCEELGIEKRTWL